jgi:hypothetical protein
MRIILNLMSSAKDKAILQFVLGTIYSSSQLRYAFGCSSLCINKNNETVRNFINKAELRNQISYQKMNFQNSSKNLLRTLQKMNVNWKEGNTD